MKKEKQKSTEAEVAKEVARKTQRIKRLAQAMMFTRSLFKEPDLTLKSWQRIESHHHIHSDSTDQNGGR